MVDRKAVAGAHVAPRVTSRLFYFMGLEIAREGEDRVGSFDPQLLIGARSHTSVILTPLDPRQAVVQGHGRVVRAGGNGAGVCRANRFGAWAREDVVHDMQVSAWRASGAVPIDILD